MSKHNSRTDWKRRYEEANLLCAAWVGLDLSEYKLIKAARAQWLASQIGQGCQASTTYRGWFNTIWLEITEEFLNDLRYDVDLEAWVMLDERKGQMAVFDPWKEEVANKFAWWQSYLLPRLADQRPAAPLLGKIKREINNR